MSQIPRLVLDNRNEEEILEQMFLRAVIMSQGTLTDTRQGSPIAAIFEGLAYALSELLWYMNLLPESVALEVMRYSTGIERIDGVAASGDFAFLLSETRGSDFVILKNSFRIPYLDSYFTPDNDIVIPSGTLEIVATMTCATTGSKYNLTEPLALNSSNPPLLGLARVYNSVPITNATDVEPLETTLSRMQAFIRRGETLVSASDYELKIVEIMGDGSRALAIPLMNGDYQENVAGHVHVFGVLPDGNLPNTTQCFTYRTELTRNTFAGSYTWVSPVALDTIDVSLVIKSNDLTYTTASGIGDTVKEFFSHKSYPMGATIVLSDLEYFIRRNNEDSVITILSTLVNSESVDVPLSKKWAIPRLNTCDITLTDGINSYTYYTGEVDELL